MAQSSRVIRSTAVSNTAIKQASPHYRWIPHHISISISGSILRSHCYSSSLPYLHFSSLHSAFSSHHHDYHDPHDRHRSIVTTLHNDGRFKDAPSPHLDHGTRIKQLLYRSKQRGWLELDIILGSWAEQHIRRLNTQQLEQVAITSYLYTIYPIKSHHHSPEASCILIWYIYVSIYI